MSVHIAVPRSPRLTARERVVGIAAVALAGALARATSPARIRRVLTAIRRGARPASAADVADARRIVTGVSPRCAGAACLERSLAVVLLCRARGTRATWCVGVSSPPLRAHAWVAVDGRAIGEPTAPNVAYTPIITV